MGVHAATAETVSIQIGSTTISFLPLVIMTQASDAPSGVLYVFSSTETIDGNAGGRSAIGEMCVAEDPDAHFCNSTEIQSAFDTTGVFFEHPFPISYLDNAYISALDNVFGGWTSTEDYGFFIGENASKTYYELCDQTLPVACCKWMP